MIIYAFKEMPLFYILRIFIRYSLKSRMSLLEEEPSMRKLI